MVSVGDVFSVKVGTQRGLCHVVASEKARGSWDAAGRWRVVTCRWVGARSELPAALKRAATFAPLVLTRLRGQMHVQSIGGPPPAGFVHVAVREPSKAVRALRSPRAPGAWQWIETQLKVELEYRADPRAFEARWAAQVAKQRAVLKKATVRAVVAPRSLGPSRRAPAVPSFGEWLAPRAFVSATRAVLRGLSRKCASVKSVGGAVGAVKQAVGAINRIDAKWGNLITTPDAEELTEALVSIASAAGLDAAFAAQVVDDVREW